MSLGALVIGLGQIGMGYDLTLDPELNVLTHARAFHRHPSFRLIGGVDPDAQRRSEFESAYSCPSYADVGSALEALSPDVVAISVPTPLHVEAIRQIFKACTPQAILCEKPLSYRLEDAREIVAMCAEYSCRLYVNYIRRADPGVHEIKQRMNDARIQLPVKGVAWYSKGLFNNGSHFLDLIQYWLGEMRSFQVMHRGRLWGDGDPEPDVMVVFEKGTVYFLAAQEEHFSHYTVELVSPAGRLRYECGGEKIIWQSARKSPSSPGYTLLDPGEERIPTEFARIQWHVVDQMAASLRGQQADICSGNEALRTIEYLTAIKEAL
jgi:predicted dehydrogenase